MIRFIVEKVDDSKFEHGPIDGYGIQIFYLVERPSSREILQSGVYELTLSQKTTKRNFLQPVSKDFQLLWTRRFIFFLFLKIKEYWKEHLDIPESNHNFHESNYAWWDSIPETWMEVVLDLEEF